MRGWWQELTGLVLPSACAGCGRPRTALCSACTSALHGQPATRVRPSPVPAGLPEVRAAAPYEGAVRAALLAHKERGALALAAPLGAALAGAVLALHDTPATAATGHTTAADTVATSHTRRGSGGRGEGGGGEGAHPRAHPPVLLVPVPSARRVVRARGHDAVRRVARAAAGELRRVGSAAVVVPVLRQRREVADQAGLDAPGRLANLAGALEVVRGQERLLSGGRVVLVDDLMTTGASLAEAARAVLEAVRRLPRAGVGIGDGCRWDGPAAAPVRGGFCPGGMRGACVEACWGGGGGAGPRGVGHRLGGVGGVDSGGAGVRATGFGCGGAGPRAGSRPGSPVLLPESAPRGGGRPGEAGALQLCADRTACATAGGVGWCGGVVLMGAAVVAASPKAFEINRNS